uniref:Uncharacterized protein LOC100185168 n=1 Tax=Phallusia mammillata TaxID=59560 RepID=A0A6F9DIF0_9ASCI|nr:uncharacterized protein LOC100185168 [Phallusia mammillata]
MSEMESTASFMDQCRIVCLSYFKEISIDSDEISDDQKTKLHNVIEKEMDAFECAKADLLITSKFLAEMSLTFGEPIVSTVVSCVEDLSHQSLNEDSFQDCIGKVIPEHQTWDHISLLLFVSYKLFGKLDLSQLVDVVDLTARYLRSECRPFIDSQGGWKITGDQMSSSGILSSIVMVDRPATTENLEMQMSHFQTESLPQVLSPPASPPFSLLQGNPDDERDSLNSATPPEMVERPPMTASLMQMMGGGDMVDNGNTGASSDSSGFEMVSGGQKKIPEPSQEMVSMPPDSELTSDAPVSPSLSRSYDKPIVSSAAAIKEESTLADYIPHISVGVAAAAACIGFLMLRKNT